jgi:predicted RNase H-like HicB family nuclease
LNPRKLLRKAIASAANLRFEEACALARAFGFHLSRVNGSHHVFARQDIPELLNLQDAGGKAKPYQENSCWLSLNGIICVWGRKNDRLSHQYSFSEEDGGYIADIPDLAYCSAFGETPEQALAEILKAKSSWIEAAQAAGKPVPPPTFKPAIYQATKVHA